MGIRTASPLLEPTVAGSLPRRRCAASPERAADGLDSELPVYLDEPGEGRCGRSLRPRRTPRLDMRISFARRSSRFSLSSSRIRAASLEVTPGSTLVDVGLSTHSGPTPPRSRAGVPPGRSLRPLSRSRRQVGARGARLALSVRRCSDATTGLSRARCPSRWWWAVLSWLLLPPTARPSRGTSRRQIEVGLHVKRVEAGSSEKL